MSERRRILSAEDSQTLSAWKLPTVVGPLVGRQREAEPKVGDLSAAASAAGFEQGDGFVCRKRARPAGGRFAYVVEPNADGGRRRRHVSREGREVVALHSTG